MQIRVHSAMAMIDAKTLAARLDEIVSPQLRQFGLVWRSDNTWAEPGNCTVRRVVRVARLKGLGAAVGWGYSLGFVPHVSGARLAYHRSFQSARLDVFEWPEDYARSFEVRDRFEEVVLIAGQFEASLKAYFDSKIAEINGWFERVHSMSGIEQELKRQAASPAWSYRLHHPAPSYVLPFVLAALGDLPEADNLATRGFTEELGPLVPELRRSLQRVKPLP